jgi:hypothetical protein
MRLYLSAPLLKQLSHTISQGLNLVEHKLNLRLVELEKKINRNDFLRETLNPDYDYDLTKITPFLSPKMIEPIVKLSIEENKRKALLSSLHPNWVNDFLERELIAATLDGVYINTNRVIRSKLLKENIVEKKSVDEI